MTLAGIALHVIPLALWGGVVASALRASFRRIGRERWLGVLGGLLMSLGVSSFVAPQLSRWLPGTVEWPVGWSGSVIKLPTGLHVVSHEPAARVQVYSADWKFIRGWSIAARGGAFVTSALPDGRIEVLTARGNSRFVYDPEGVLLSSGSVPSSAYPSSSGVSLGQYVRTWPWLITLSNPFIGFMTIIAGIAVLAFNGRLRLQRHANDVAGSSDPPPGASNMGPCCPACSSAIALNDINVKADTAICRTCGHATAYSSLIHAPVTSVHTAPPDGCDVQDVDDRWRAVASTRSWRFFPTFFFAIIWNAIVLAIASGLIFGGGHWFILLFMSAHIGAGLFVMWSALCFAIGDVEVVIARDEVSVGTGIGPVRWWRRRPLRDVRGVRQEMRPRSPFGPNVLVLDGPRPLRFGGALKDERRYFLHAAIAAKLQTRHA